MINESYLIWNHHIIFKFLLNQCSMFIMESISRNCSVFYLFWILIIRFFRFFCFKISFYFCCKEEIIWVLLIQLRVYILNSSRNIAFRIIKSIFVVVYFSLNFYHLRIILLLILLLNHQRAFPLIKNVSIGYHYFIIFGCLYSMHLICTSLDFFDKLRKLHLIFFLLDFKSCQLLFKLLVNS